MPSTYVKKNGVATRLVGIPKGWNVVNTFNVASTAWVANSDSTTSSTYPYVATISTTYFTNDSQPIWQMNGVGTLPTDTEREAINLVLEAIFTSTGVTLYATDQPTVNLVLETGGFATSYASGTTAAQDVTYSNTISGLTATDVQAAIDELKALIPVQPQYITTGLLFNGVTLVDGGYYIDNGIVHFDITVYVTVYRAGGDALIDTLPVAAGYNSTSPYAINATMNGVAVTHAGSGSSYPTRITAMSAIGVGTTVHYVGTYAYGA